MEDRFRGLYVVKICCLALFCVSVFGIVRNAQLISSETSVEHASLGLFACVLCALFWASALDGIFKRRPVVWKMGWPVIVTGYVLFAVDAGWSILVVRKNPDHPYVQFAVAEGAGALVCAYWCYFWYRYKDYFLPSAHSQ